MHLENSDHGAPTGPPGISQASTSNRQVPTILLVEDEALVREVACEILGSAGYRVLPTQNAAEAATAFSRFPGEIQLLLTDVVLPDRDGCELAQELAALGARISAIFISGYPENCVTRKGLQRPGWFYLPKPFSAASLLQKIQDVLRQDVQNRDIQNQDVQNQDVPKQEPV